MYEATSTGWFAACAALMVARNSHEVSLVLVSTTLQSTKTKPTTANMTKSNTSTNAKSHADQRPGIDPHAKSVRVQLDGESLHIGFVPRRLVRLVRSGSAQIVDVNTFDVDGSSVYYCRV
eukprot:CAMPEP_0182562656 /NCGR_PEP_ID=MMETSP1324-20130603/4958_1 /TAXON_ID=236786 /ORGANISM="Florenciella sp., Strain RCC1587" /LENGTH=119 /DNA_ID=CAMNT_0024775661 /DNA_START=93 /DNA_END=452 /DNA_ORIENTATION=-